MDEMMGGGDSRKRWLTSKWISPSQPSDRQRLVAVNVCQRRNRQTVEAANAE
jgi:hypothetical protein